MRHINVPVSVGLEPLHSSLAVISKWVNILLVKTITFSTYNFGTFSVLLMDVNQVLKEHGVNVSPYHKVFQNEY